MSYPPQRYAGETGEASARLRPAGSDPDLVYPSGVKVDYLATGKTTDGDFGLYRWNFGPNETGPGPHFHRTMTESFTPGAPREDDFQGLAELYSGKELSEEERDAFFLQHDNHSVD